MTAWQKLGPHVTDINQVCNINGSMLDAGGSGSYLKEYYDTVVWPSKLALPPFWTGRFLEPNEFRCYLTKFTEFCNETGIIAFLSLFLIFLIVIITFFGKIKENYRWFILNQAIWDLVILFRTFCIDQYPYGDHKRYYNSWCFINTSSKEISPTGFYLEWIISYDFYLPLMLLSVSRFICLYFPNFYDKVTKNWRIFCWLFGLNFIFILCTITSKMGILPYNIREILEGINAYKFLICLVSTIFAIISVIGLIIKHSKFQYQHNRNHFYGSIRIAAVMTFQLLMNLFIFIIELFNYLGGIDKYILFQINVYALDDSSFYWMSNHWGLGSIRNYSTVKELKVLIDTLLVLTIMTGYREAIVRFIKVFIFRKTSAPLPAVSLMSSTAVIQTKVINLKLDKA